MTDNEKRGENGGTPFDGATGSAPIDADLDGLPDFRHMTPKDLIRTARDAIRRAAVSETENRRLQKDAAKINEQIKKLIADLDDFKAGQSELHRTIKSDHGVIAGLFQILKEAGKTPTGSELAEAVERSKPND